MRITIRVALALLFVANAHRVNAQSTAFVGGRVIDGTGRVIDNGTVVINGAKITAVGSGLHTRARGRDSSGPQREDDPSGPRQRARAMSPATMGLQSDTKQFYTRDNLLRQLRTYAMYGITTVFSLGDDQEAGFALRNENGSATDRAKVFVAGPVINGATAEEARAMAVRSRRHEAGPAEDPR
jgi:hypothetical protein